VSSFVSSFLYVAKTTLTLFFAAFLLTIKAGPAQRLKSVFLANDLAFFKQIFVSCLQILNQKFRSKMLLNAQLVLAVPFYLYFTLE
jgi:hypothetical protein